MPSTKLKELFTQHHVLMLAFFPIERIHNRYFHEPPLDLNDRHAQERLRQGAWRITEEVSEYLNSNGLQDSRSEVVDCFHFMLEFAIMAGYDNYIADSIPDNYPFVKLDQSDHCGLGVIRSIGQAVNQLKNRVWKQTLKPMNEHQVEVFQESLYRAFINFFSLCSCVGINNLDELKQAYEEVHEQNQERIKQGV